MMCAVDSRLYEPRTVSSNMINVLSYIQTNIAKYHTQPKILLYQLWHSRVHFGRKKQLWQLFGKSFPILFTSYSPEKACLNSLAFFPALELGSLTAQITTEPAQHCLISVSTNTALSSVCTLALPVGWWKPCSSSNVFFAPLHTATLKIAQGFQS